MSKWYEVWGREPGSAGVELLEKFPADSVTMADVTEEVEAMKRDGVTHIEVKPVDEADRN